MADKTQFLSPEQIAVNRERYLRIFRENVKRHGVEDLLSWLETTDFFVAPSSTRFHGNYDGGLCEHSLNVYQCLVDIANRHPEFVYSDETLALVALTHDFIKISQYRKCQRNRKNEYGKWESYTTYEIHDEEPGGHGEKSCYLVQQFMYLSYEEWSAILFHMGGFTYSVQGGDRSMNAAMEVNKLIPMLQIADQEASHLIEFTVVH